MGERPTGQVFDRFIQGLERKGFGKHPVKLAIIKQPRRSGNSDNRSGFTMGITDMASNLSAVHVRHADVRYYDIDEFVVEFSNSFSTDLREMFGFISVIK